jgi:hypothetical protein
MGITAAAVAAPASASLVSVLNNGGFESTFRNGTFCASLDVTYGPADYGKWAVGDAACSVTGPAFSITPRGDRACWTSAQSPPATPLPMSIRSST